MEEEKIRVNSHRRICGSARSEEKINAQHNNINGYLIRFPIEQ